MAAGTFNPSIIRGDDYDLTMRFWDDQQKTVARDLSGSTFASQLRLSANAIDAIDFEIDDSDAVTGVIVLTLTHEETADLLSSYAWDFQETDGTGRIVTQVRGTANVTPDVTR